ncbi:pilin [Halomonas sp. 7T]|nr:pilin [Halomonas sp. 7T]
MGRAQAAEAFTATAGVRTDIAVYYAENGSFLGYTSSGGNANFNQGSAGALNGQYIGEVALNGTQNGAYNVTFDAGVHDGKTITFTPLIGGVAATAGDASASANGQISGWQCASEDIGDTFLPSACR